MARKRHTPKPTTLRCCLCEHKIDPKDIYWPKIAGFARPKALSGQSGSSLVLRATTGEVACNPCITASVHGINRQQGTLS
jgi:hypothetical protein